MRSMITIKVTGSWTSAKRLNSITGFLGKWTIEIAMGNWSGYALKGIFVSELHNGKAMESIFGRTAEVFHLSRSSPFRLHWIYSFCSKFANKQKQLLEAIKIETFLNVFIFAIFISFYCLFSLVVQCLLLLLLALVLVKLFLQAFVLLLGELVK